MAVDIRLLADQVVKFVVPILDSKAVNEVKDELSSAFNNEVRILWRKVRGLFIEDIKDNEIIKLLQQKPNDIEVQSELKGALSHILTQKPKLAEELDKLFSNAKKFSSETENVVKKIKGENNKIVQGNAEHGKMKNTIEEVEGDNNKIYQGINKQNDIPHK